MPDTIDPYGVDGYTAATQPQLAEVVVKDAVYTCHTLWHTVYGPSQDAIHEILWKFISLQEVHAHMVERLLGMFQEKILGVGALNLIFRMISVEHLQDSQKITLILNNLSEHENGYVRNLTQRLLDE